MRVLILSAVLALAAAAPSGVAPIAPVVPLVAKVAVLPVATPTIDPGDIQAAAINAQVYAEDQARALAEKAVEENNEKAIEADSEVQEKTEEAFWSAEDKKWQALDAAQTVNAKIDGAVANNADALARSALGGLIIPTFVAPIYPGIPAPLAPVAPIAYATPNLIPNKDEKQDKELGKSAEIQNDNKTEGDKKLEEDKKDEKNEKENLALPLITPTLKLTQPWVAPSGYVAPPGYVAPVGPVSPIAPVAPLPVGAFTYVAQPILTPVLKTQW